MADHAGWTDLPQFAPLQPPPFARLIASLSANLDREQGRWFYWLPVIFGAGIGLYFALPDEPSYAMAGAAVTGAASIRVFLRQTLVAFLAGSILLTLACGFAAAKLRAGLVAAPVIQKHVKTERLSGWVERWEQTSPKRGRLTLRVIAIEGLEAGKTPFRVRISLNATSSPPLGEAITLKAVLTPLFEPVMPGGFDFARQAWFLRIGASGFAFGGFERLASQPPVPLMLRLKSAVNGLRQHIAKRIREALPEDHAGIAQALIIGERAGLSDEETKALRASGLFHIISISGLHLALIAGALFWAIRLGLALIPAVALRFPVKAWAAAGALGGAFIYFLLSGAEIATQRSFIMIVVMLMAVMLNRPAISLRNVALAALIILALFPESLLDASFQMSFAATTALIAFYERFGGAMTFKGRGVFSGMAAWGLTFFAGLAVTTVVAGTAVTPFSAYHFHNITSYSVLGNLLGMPFVSLIIMPAVLLTLIALPFGLEAWPLAGMGLGIEALKAIAAWVASLEGALVAVPAYPQSALAAMGLGALWFLIWQGTWRYFGLIAFAAGLALAPQTSRPDILISRSAEVIGVRDGAGFVQAAPGRKDRITVERWLAADGDRRTAAEVRKSNLFQCDTVSCLAKIKGKLIAFTREPAALAEDCARADIVIAPFWVSGACTKPELLIDKKFLMENGAVSITLRGGAMTVETANGLRGRRPWVSQRRFREDIDPLPEEGGDLL